MDFGKVIYNTESMKYLLNTALFENLSSAKVYLAKNHIDINDEGFLKIKSLLKDNAGYTYIFTKFYYEDKLKFEQLVDLLDQLKKLKPVIGNLPKQIDKYESYESLIDDMMKIESYIRFNKAVSELPSKLKQEARSDNEFFRLVEGMDDEVLSDYIAFLKSKSSAYNDISSLIEATINHIGSYLSKVEVLDKISKSPGAVLLYNRNDIIIAHIKDEPASKKLGSVSWCISTRGMWLHYNSPDKLTKQYFVWNFRVSYSDNDFQLGATINADGSIQTSHLKDDSYVNLDTYCEKYKLNRKRMFKPLSKNEIVTSLRSSKMSTEVFKQAIEFDVWKEMVDIIPFNWRIMRGLLISGDSEKMTKVQKIAMYGKIDDAVEFLNSGVEMLNFERYLIVDAFDFSDMEELATDTLKPLFEQPVFDSEPRWTFYYDEGEATISLTMKKEDYADTLETDEWVVNMIESGNTDGALGHYSDEYQYFYSYLTDTDRLKELFLDIGVYLEEDDQEKWLDKISDLGKNLDEPLKDFVIEVIEMAEQNLGLDLEKAKEAIIFTYEENYRNKNDGKIIMPLKQILFYLSENPENNGDMCSILESHPNEAAGDFINQDEMYISAYSQDIDTTEASEKALNKIEELIDDDDTLRDHVSFRNRFKETALSLGFTERKNTFSKENSKYKIVIHKLTLSNVEKETISGEITLIETGKVKKFEIPAKDLGSLENNHKMDFFFERKFWDKYT